MKAEKIYLVGFMGAGKTTVARALAKRLDWNMIDIDEAIERREHQTVAAVFAKHAARRYFRAAVERTVLLEQVGVSPRGRRHRRRDVRRRPEPRRHQPRRRLRVARRPNRSADCPRAGRRPASPCRGST